MQEADEKLCVVEKENEADEEEGWGEGGGEGGGGEGEEEGGEWWEERGRKCNVNSERTFHTISLCAISSFSFSLQVTEGNRHVSFILLCVLRILMNIDIIVEV